jgi:predicted nucleic acid-binding protein
MQSAIISDTSCLILLDKIGELHLLNKLYGTIVLTPEIVQEFDKKLPDWFDIKSPVNKTYQRILEASLDLGEASAIALAIEEKDSLLIIDELKGRKFAEQLGLKFTGTLGVLIHAKQKDILKSVKPALDRIKQTNFRLTKELERKVLVIVGELED